MSLVLKAFEYLEPRTIEEAVRMLSVYGTKAKVIAGGCDLLPSIRQQRIQPEYVISIGNIPGLDYIESGGEGLGIGPLTKIRSVEP